METVQIRNLKIGEGMPKICAPIAGISREEIISEAKLLCSHPVDIAEWRADWFEDISDIDNVREVLKELRLALAEIPLLFTFRTAQEGGEQAISLQNYVTLNKMVIETKMADLIDIELSTGEDRVTDLIRCAHAHDVKVIVSNHDFQKTPVKKELVERLCKMNKLGADIPKIAVMPKNRKDVLTLLSATEEASEKLEHSPVITMSMGELGVISRICGETFGSSVTFGAVKKASAPGQMDVNALAEVLEIIHKI